MRIITKIEGVRKRFGDANEQVFAWLPVPFNIIIGGLALYSISVFAGSVFGIDLTLLIVVLGITVTIITVLGGAWAAAASDFVQMLLLLSITLVMAFQTQQHPQINGLSELFHKLPAQHFNWTLFERPWIVVFFAATLLINQLVQNNSMMLGAAKYVYVKNGADAKKATLVSLIGFIGLPFTWMIPAMASTILHPNLASEYPQLNNPHEASYVAMAMTLLPPGLLGLLVSAIFAASVAYMTSLLTIAAGIFVRNFYIRVIRKNATEARQIFVGRAFTLIYGLLWIATAMFFKTYKSLPLFDLLLLTAASIQIPMVVPLFFGMFVKRTPAWSGWSTMVVGFSVSILLRVFLSERLFNSILSPAIPFSQREIGDLDIATTTAVLFAVCIAWFFGTMVFYTSEDHEYVAQVDRFFQEMNTPIAAFAEDGGSYETDSRQYRVLGNLCLIYGAFILLLLLIPNPVRARLCILFCGSFLVVPGIVLRVLGRRVSNRRREGHPQLVAEYVAADHQHEGGSA